MAEQAGEKTEQATPQKLNQAKDKGQIWKSKDLTSAMVLTGALWALVLIGPMMVNDLKSFVVQSAGFIAQPALAHRAERSMGYAMLTFAKVIGPFVSAVALVALLVEGIQSRGIFTPDAVKPKLENIDPLKGLKSIFSKKQLIELLMSALKIGAAGIICYWAIKQDIGALQQMMRVSPVKSGFTVGALAAKMALRIVMLFIGLAIFDTFHQYRSYMKEMMMTREEVKQEFKQSEGDPQHKAQRKQLHQEILQGNATAATEKADVVVTNPDHIAIALKYDEQKDGAPRVVAKGQRGLAEKIKEVARQKGIPIMRNVPLAHALLRVEVGKEIPDDLYDAVAEVLNLVYALTEPEGAREGAPAKKPEGASGQEGKT